MIYALAFELTAVQTATYYVGENRNEIIDVARSLGAMMYEHLRDQDKVDGDETGIDERSVRDLLASKDDAEFLDGLGQLNDAAVSWKYGFITLDEFSELFECVDQWGLEELMGPALRVRFQSLKSSYGALVREIGDALV